MSTTFRARYVFTAVGEPIPSGTVSVEAGRIVAVGRHGGAAAELGNVAIVPGLVNAHAHLDFSNLSRPLGYRGIPLVDWLRLVMAFRRETPPDATAVAQGLRESFSYGVKTLADIVQSDWPQDAVVSSGVNVTAFLELIAPTAKRVADASALAERYLQADDGPHPSPLPKGEGTCCYRGLSPHAPYTVQPELLAAVVRLSQKHKIPIAMHLAESPEELELLQTGGGPLRVFLEELGTWRPTLIPHESRPLDYLRTLAAAWRVLVVHGNYLNDEEIDFLGKHADRMTAVYCPRTHDWFAHRRYPLAEMLAAGVPVALGTDGRGSSPDLNLLEEMRFAAQKHPMVSREQILRMGTIFGATALGQAAETGSLEVGKRADLTIIHLPERDASDPYELLFDLRSSIFRAYPKTPECFKAM
jgi:cytosine/adenosine deaminase-related metal-dependent hydrolase